MASETTPPGQPVIDMGYLSLPAEVQQAVEADVAARRAPEAPAVPVTREQVREMVSAAIEEALWDAGSPPASERVTDAIWPLLERAQADGAKLAEVRAVLLEGGQDHGTVRRRALAITGSDEEGVRGGSYDVWGADFGVVGGKA